MTTPPVTNGTPSQVQTKSKFSQFLDNLPGAKVLKNLNIGFRLMLGFGILVITALVIIGFSYTGSIGATKTINLTGDLRVPAVLISSKAEANLLRTLADVRGYLALGDPKYRESYERNQATFAANLQELKALSPELNPQDQTRIQDIEVAFKEWSELPEKLFALRDDQLEREPAYKLLATTGSELAGNILIDVDQIIELQGKRNPTEENLESLADMAKFQGSFAAMFSGLRGYVTTRNRIFRLEYEGNFDVNQNNWQRLLNQEKNLTPNQQTLFDNIKTNREEFLRLPEQLFELLESDKWREDLHLFRTKTVPLADKMDELLDGLTNDQQQYLQTDLNTGRQGLDLANRRTVMGGVIALVLGLFLSFVSRENIAGPVGRLTQVAERIRHGDLEAQAMVESKDEIGTLATTFNNMTTKLRDTLFQVRKEKDRADSLLDVVIPIGVQLSSEKDFNRLLETMLAEAKRFCNADAGTLYLRTPQDELEAVIIHNDSQDVKMGGTSSNKVTAPKISLINEDTGEPNEQSITAYTVLSGASVNVPDRYQDERFQTTKSAIFDIKDNYRAISYLSIPLKNNENKVIGAMQLVNARDSLLTKEIIPFDANIQQLMESYSSLAVAALEAYQREQILRQEIKQLRIQIDEVKREQAVKAIVETESFAELQAKAEGLRKRRKRRSQNNE